ncbi:hypothetical protein V2G26_014424 [Clonostachys chloroleuca]
MKQELNPSFRRLSDLPPSDLAAATIIPRLVSKFARRFMRSGRGGVARLVYVLLMASRAACCVNRKEALRNSDVWSGPGKHKHTFNCCHGDQ